VIEIAPGYLSSRQMFFGGQTNQQSFYGYYTGKSVLASTPS